MKITCKDLDAFELVSQQFSQFIQPGDCVLLSGEMGSGKTTFVSGVARGLGYNWASSPTYVIISDYLTEPKIYHVDLYRLTDDKDVGMLDLERCFDDSNAVTFVEWPERLGRFYPKAYVHLTFMYNGDSARDIVIKGIGQDYEARLACFNVSKF